MPAIKYSFVLNVCITLASNPELTFIQASDPILVGISIVLNISLTPTSTPKLLLYISLPGSFNLLLKISALFINKSWSKKDQALIFYLVLLYS